jgi:hypothetical protein
MRICIMTLGPRGEFELFLTLARRLRLRGHQVLLGTAPFFGDRVRQAGVEWTPLGMGTFPDQLEALRLVSGIPDRLQRVKEYAQKWLYPQLALSGRHFLYLAQRIDYFINKLRYTMKRQDEQILPCALLAYDMPILAGNLPPLEEGASDDGPILNLVAMNKQLVDPDDLAGPRYQFTGFWRAERPPTAGVPAALEDFVRAGPRPVVLAMGSLVMFDAQRLAETFTAALRLTGQRGVIVNGWSGLMQSTLGAQPMLSGAGANGPDASWVLPAPAADGTDSFMAGWSANPQVAVAGSAPVVGGWGTVSGVSPVAPAPALPALNAPAASLSPAPATLEPAPILGRSAAAAEAPNPAAVLPAPHLPVLLDDSVLCVDEVSYEWLFSQASCVIHQGGLGTLTEVLHAGVPSIILPQIPPQEDFYRVLDRNHLAAGNFDAATVDPLALAGAIQRALTDEEMGRSCRHWQGVVAAERGLDRALDLIEEHAKNLPEKSQQAQRTFRRRRDPGGW